MIGQAKTGEIFQKYGSFFKVLGGEILNYWIDIEEINGSVDEARNLLRE